MTVEQDQYGEFYVRGNSDNGETGWGIQVCLKESNKDGPADHLTVINGEFYTQQADQEKEVETTEKKAILSLIAQWERLPLMVAAPID